MISLVRSCPSLPIILKLSGLSWCPVSWLCAWIGKGSLRFLIPLPQGPRCFTNVFFTTVYGSTLVTVYYLTLLFLGVLVLWPYQHLFEGPVTSEVALNAILGAGVFDAFPRPWTYGITMCPILGLPLKGVDVWLLLLEVLVSCDVLPAWVLLLPLSSQLPFITLFCTLFITHLEYLYLNKASLRCCNPSLRSSGVVEIVLALWVSVPMTLYLAERLWWLSHCKYWSVWVGLQYTFMLRELSASGLTKVSRKGIGPFSWLPSTVNFILGSILFIWSRKSSLWACCWMTQVSSTNLYHNLGGERQT